MQIDVKEFVRNWSGTISLSLIVYWIFFPHSSKGWTVLMADEEMAGRKDSIRGDALWVVSFCMDSSMVAVRHVCAGRKEMNEKLRPKKTKKNLWVLKTIVTSIRITLSPCYMANRQETVEPLELKLSHGLTFIIKRGHQKWPCISSNFWLFDHFLSCSYCHSPGRFWISLCCATLPINKNRMEQGSGKKMYHHFSPGAVLQVDQLLRDRRCSM